MGIREKEQIERLQATLRRVYRNVAFYRTLFDERGIDVEEVRELDALLSDKNAVANAMEESVRRQAAALGIELVSLGIKDIILPGDMKELMNKVIQAQKAAEANLISRREETAAMRSQANTAKLLQASPTLMRLRELEVLEKIAKTAAAGRCARSCAVRLRTCATSRVGVDRQEDCLVSGRARCSRAIGTCGPPRSSRSSCRPCGRSGRRCRPTTGWR